MSPSVRRGLGIAVDLLDRELSSAKGGLMSAREELDIANAIVWIGDQFRIDAKRRNKRGKYRSRR